MPTPGDTAYHLDCWAIENQYPFREHRLTDAADGTAFGLITYDVTTATYTFELDPDWVSDIKVPDVKFVGARAAEFFALAFFNETKARC